MTTSTNKDELKKRLGAAVAQELAQYGLDHGLPRVDWRGHGTWADGQLVGVANVADALEAWAAHLELGDGDVKNGVAVCRGELNGYHFSLWGVVDRAALHAHLATVNGGAQ